MVLLGVGGIIATRNWALGMTTWLVDLAAAATAAALHDRAHRRHAEPPHALWGEGDRHKPSFLR